MAGEPLFTALATSTRQLHSLLRCIAFTTNAEVHITPEGLRFTTEEVHAVQATTLLEKSLFSSYLLQSGDDQPPIPPFQVNIIALLETLQIFGISDSGSAYKNQNGGISSSYAAAFNTPALGLGGTCKITYAEAGSPLSITIEESGVKTTCEMNTYNLSNMYDEDNEIPLDRNALVLKIIMPSTWLHDAISELASTNSDSLVVNASSISAPYFSLEGHGGPFGDSTVDFAPEVKPDALSETSKKKKQPQVTETFTVAAPTGGHGRVRQKYKFDLIKKAGRAMNVATKVSIRQDRQGVLSLQFMIEAMDTQAGSGPGNAASSGRFSFIDFRFVPSVESDDEYEQDDEAASEDSE
ncbi:checkpoint clamp complex protein Rad1 [Knufia obscura]|uniref:Checkpoint clamp complex protein Rad1 n=2 Tax=Knufia TaxID=430999 RepID=A0AAN8EBA8_9EURO|nr:checkpoint clamp complex protein Rad1 [Knufia obscura]KAK5950853.1 checkpoint clamp complex protein Rad1 [Knufia fluminis]